jgi:hypothetical protein
MAGPVLLMLSQLKRTTDLGPAHDLTNYRALLKMTTTGVRKKIIG